MPQEQSRTRTGGRRTCGRRRPHPAGAWPSGPRRAFTLIELLSVIVIIGIILVLILIAAQGAQRQAEEAATQSLIAKLDAAINDRLDALLQARPDYNWTHRYMSRVWYYDNNKTLQWSESLPRAQVIAWYDFIKAEMPDVFYVQNATGPYPLNFAFPVNGLPGSPLTTMSTAGQAVAPAILPLGNSLQNYPTGNSYGAGNTYNPSGTGVFGASYFAAVGVYKNLGYLPTGFDGSDNSGNDLVDEWAEGVNSSNSALVTANLSAHKHHTARAEMLYALLVEGVGPLGSVFNRDDFTDKEVRDTDGDGLPEFIDAWGNPLQFFRWPVLYPSDVQRGQVEPADLASGGLPTLVPPYYSNPTSSATFMARENSPLDPNNLLVAPAWWSATQNPMSPYGMSATAQNGSPAVSLFEQLFHRLSEPLQHSGNPTYGNSAFYWDRGGSADFGFRRAFYTRPLILSSGPDGTPGVYLIPDGGSSSMPLNATNLIHFENSALTFDPIEAGFNGSVLGIQTFGQNTNSYAIWQAGRDDITNQNRQTAGGGGGS